jgi:hypothetical protein
MIINENGNVNIGSGYASNSYLLTISGNSNHTGQAVFSNTNTPISIVGPSTSTSGTSIQCATRFGSGKFTYIFNGANVNSYNNTAIVQADCGIAYSNNTGSSGYLICPQLSSASAAGTRWSSNGDIVHYNNLTISQTGLITTSDNISYGRNSTILATNTTLTFPLNRVIFVNAAVTPITITLPTLTSSHNGLMITIRALPTCTNTVTITFSSSQVMYNSNSSTSSTSYPIFNSASVLHLTAINSYWLQI